MSTYHHGDLRSAILSSASKVLEKEGISGLSLREAARRAGVSHSAPYRHFADREALLAALAAQGFLILEEQLKKNAGRKMGAAYVRFALKHPQRFRLMFGGSLPMKGYPELGAAASAAYENLVSAMKREKDILQPDLAAAAAWSLVHGLAHLLLDGHFPEKSEDFVNRVLGAVRFAAGAQRSA
jgi:AcrR family transcriptional regulator